MRILENFKKIYRKLIAFNNIIYHYLRFYKYSGTNFEKINGYNFEILKVAHALEKSIFMPEQRDESGWENAKILFDLLNISSIKKEGSESYFIGVNVYNKFIEHKKSNGIVKDIKKIDLQSENFLESGKIKIDEQGFKSLQNPEKFFLSRYSFRDFKSKIINDITVKRILNLASKTPSTCNRQHWFTYNINNKEIIKKALSFQSGNRGFTEYIHNLFIITSDLSAFKPGQEVYQHWIDGGMYAMSVMYAIHSLGLVSCPLNWSTTPRIDREIRKKISIKKSHSIIMMIAYGEPKNNIACVSQRKSIENFYKVINE